MVVVFTCTFVTGPIAGLALCLLPMVSGFLLHLSLHDDEALKPVPLLPVEDRPKLAGDFIRVGLGSLAIYACLGFAWGTMDYSTMMGWGGTHLIPYVIGAGLAIVVAVLSISYASRLDLFGLYRWLIPVILLGLVLLSIESFWTRFFSFMFITVGQYGFDIIVWIYFSRIVRKGVCSGSVAIGINRGFIQAGVFIGSLIAMASVRLISDGVLMLPLIVLVLSGVMTSVVLMVLDRKDQLERMTGYEVVPPRFGSDGHRLRCGLRRACRRIRADGARAGYSGLPGARPVASLHPRGPGPLEEHGEHPCKEPVQEIGHPFASRFV